MVKFFTTILPLITLMNCLLPAFGKNCPSLRLVNGRIRSTLRGRTARFNCNRGYQLVGVKYAICTNGKWDADEPICVKYGCRAPSTVQVNGQFIESYRGAVVKIICNPGYSLVGSASVYCNGYRWNETFPTCKMSTTNPALSCDFENSDLCGWSQDPMHDFDWIRIKSMTSSGEVIPNPVFDHTFGENGSGHFMQLGRFKSNIENSTARLYSPVYPSNYSNNSCFKFWYYMHGNNTGSFKIYVKPERIELYDLIPYFWVNEEPEKSWIEGFFSLKLIDSPFQIVVEGVKGPGYVNDTGFDDVKITFGEECIVPEETTTSMRLSTFFFPTEEEIFFSTPYLVSCKNRCDQITESEYCQCNSACLKNGNCCSDFSEICNSTVATSTISTTASTSSTKITSTTSTTPSTSKTLEKAFQPLPQSPSIHLKNNESNHIDPHNPVVSMSSKNVTNTNSDLNRKLEKDDGIPKPKSKPVNPEMEKNKNKFTQWKVPIFYPKNIKFPKPAINKMETKQEKENKPKGMSPKAVTLSEDLSKVKMDVERTFGEKNLTVPKEGSHTTSSTSLIAPITPVLYKSKRLNLTKFEKSFIPAPSIGSGLYKGKPKEIQGKDPPQAIKIDKHEDSSKTTLRGILGIGGAFLVFLIITVLGIFWYQRSKNRKAERESMVEDSDVRFLTSDEVLDFTLAQPADDDL